MREVFAEVGRWVLAGWRCVWCACTEGQEVAESMETHGAEQQQRSSAAAQQRSSSSSSSSSSSAAAAEAAASGVEEGGVFEGVGRLVFRINGLYVRCTCTVGRGVAGSTETHSPQRWAAAAAAAEAGSGLSCTQLLFGTIPPPLTLTHILLPPPLTGLQPALEQ